MLVNNKGITLIALVITIIILLILASVATISGLSAVKYVKFNNAKSQFEMVQSKVYTWNKDEMKNYGENLNASAQSTLDTLEEGNTGYKYFSADYLKTEFDIEGISYDFLINIATRKVLLVGGITYQDKTYYTAEDFGINSIK